MKVVKVLARIAVFLGAITALLFWLVGTNSGLNTVLYLAKLCSGYDIQFERAEGKIIGQPIVLHNLTYRAANNTLKITKLNVDWQFKTLDAYAVSGFEFLLPQADLIAAHAGTKLQTISAKIILVDQKQILDLKITGTIDKHLINGYVVATKNTDWNIDQALLKVADNLFSLKAIPDDGYAWQLDLVKPELIFKEGHGKLHARGTITHLTTLPLLNAEVSAPELIILQHKIRNLQIQTKMSKSLNEPLIVKAHADQLIINDHTISSANIEVNGTSTKHNIKIDAKYVDHKINLYAAGNYADLIWSTENLIVKCDDQQIGGIAQYNFKQHSANTKLAGKIFELPTEINAILDPKQNLALTAHVQANAHNYAKGQLTLTEQKLDGLVDIYADDLQLIMRWLPDLTRFKGILQANAKISGTLDDPIMETQAHLTQVTATFPGFGVKVKPMEVHVLGDRKGKFIITGTGKMRRGPGDFTISGFIEPFKPNMPNELLLVGKHVEFINNATAHLVASTDLKFVYNHSAYRLDVIGYLEVEEGNIYFPEHNVNTVKSKDIVFINEPIVETQKSIALNPSVSLRIVEGVNFAGFGLNADISGKLDITQRHDATYAEGRVTIKQGSFKIPGQELKIDKGRLLYPPGTLLTNPMLDIKLQGKNFEADKSEDLELVVQGTAQAPVISANGLNTDKALSQAILTGGGVLSKNVLHDKLKITELGLTSKEDETMDFFGTSKNGVIKDPKNLKNKDFVVGRPLGKKLYIQYLHSLSEANQRVRLKYALNNTWSIGLESGTQGNGADLSFSFER